MKKSRFGVLLMVCALAITGCNTNNNNNTPVTRETKLLDKVSALSWYDVENDSVESIILSDKIEQISGLCFTDDGRLFCELDRTASVHQIDPQTGKIIKTFYLKDSSDEDGKKLKPNFEDISIVGNRFFLAHTHGRLYEFKEGSEGEHVSYTVYKTKLTKDNNIEGLCYDPETNSLLMACRNFPGEGYEKGRTVYTFSLTTKTLADVPRFFIPSRKLRKNSAEKEFNPSGITRHPITGTFFVIASHGKMIVELSKEGDLLNEKDLPDNIHFQPEGIAFSKDGTMYISNEGKDKAPTLVSYKMNRKENKIQVQDSVRTSSSN